MEFGCKTIDSDIIAKLGHPFVGSIFNLHRNLDTLLNSGEPFYVYTGRGPSSESLHVGHLIPFIFTKWLQDKFNCPVVIQITDDEKYVRDTHLTFEQISYYADENIKDILSLGFNPELTTIIRDSRHTFSRDIERLITIHDMQKLFGFNSDSNVGEYVFPAKEISLAFGKFAGFNKNMKCLIVAGIEQDPYFRFTSDLAKKLKLPCPAAIYGKLIPGIDGSDKMSASNPSSCVYIHESIDEIKNKMKNYDPTIRDIIIQTLTS